MSFLLAPRLRVVVPDVVVRLVFFALLLAFFGLVLRVAVVFRFFGFSAPLRVFARSLVHSVPCGLNPVQIRTRVSPLYRELSRQTYSRQYGTRCCLLS